jgi:hypothetical protein
MQTAVSGVAMAPVLGAVPKPRNVRGSDPVSGLELGSGLGHTSITPPQVSTKSAQRRPTPA